MYEYTLVRRRTDAYTKNEFIITENKLLLLGFRRIYLRRKV